MMLGRIGKGVVGGPDPGHRGDVGKLAHRCVGDIGHAVTIGIVFKGRVDDARQRAHLAPCAELAVDDLSAAVDHGGDGR